MESIMIGDHTVIKVVKIKGNSVTLGVEAPRAVVVLRSELDRQNDKKESA
jgi:carbon storage regulator CsrA